VAYSHFERLSALDATFLEVEDRNAHMHVGAVAIFDAAPLTGASNGLEIERIRELVEATLHRMPRYRQRLAWTPFTNHPVWVDDARFNLHYHLRHLSLPRPGNERLLKRLVGQVMSQPLDRGKPLWELWVVEGLEDNRFAILTKAHHCMVDGVGTAELMASTMATSPDSSAPSPRRFLPRPVPSRPGLVLGELRHRAGSLLAGLRAARRTVSDPRSSFASFREAVTGVGETLGATLRPASPTPLNVEIGPHRRFDWVRFELADVKEVKNRLGGTVNDVVLANVSGALRHFLRRRGEKVETLDFRAMVPVNIRTPGERGVLGNRVAMTVARLPLDEPKPHGRLRRVIETTRKLKASKQVVGVEALEELSDWTVTTLFAEFARLTARSRPYNVVVTNVPGPQSQAYLLGAPMLHAYPLVPLYRNQALGIALFSYHGGLFWGFNADWDAVPDLHDLVEALVVDFEALRKAASGNQRPSSTD
jgi:WS/DGAT/MGAT family acyltransferase